jgi:hypothetical protein
MTAARRQFLSGRRFDRAANDLRALCIRTKQRVQPTIARLTVRVQKYDWVSRCLGSAAIPRRAGISRRPAQLDYTCTRKPRDRGRIITRTIAHDDDFDADSCDALRQYGLDCASDPARFVTGGNHYRDQHRRSRTITH